MGSGSTWFTGGGYGPDHDTWEPLVNLSCSLETVADFDALWERPRTRRETLEPKLSLGPHGWKEIKLVNQTKYLGIVFSNTKNTYATMEANFGPALEKARARLSSYRTVFSNVPLSTRVLIVNVFVTSLFSYLIGFFLIPYPIYWAYRALVARSVVPYHGKAFKYEHLTMPPALMGTRTCLSDLWAQNVFRLLSRSKFRALGKELVNALPWPLNSKDDSNGVCYYSPVFDDSVNLALMEFLSSRFLDWDGADLAGLSNADIKRALVKHGLHRVKESNEGQRARYDDLVVKFKQYNTTPDRTLEHFLTLSPSTPNSHLEHHLLLYTNALATDKRVRHFAPATSVHPLKSQWYPYPCYFCDLGTDSIKHIYGDCVVVRNLLQGLSKRSGNLPPAISTTFINSLDSRSPLFIMDFPLGGKGSLNGAAFLLAFNREVWLLRRLLRAGGSSLFDPVAFKKKITRHSHLWSPDRPKCFSSSKYGNASNRTKTQKARCLNDSLRMIESAGPNATLVYTDGSSLGNPGPAGAGAYLCKRVKGVIIKEEHLYYPLGINTNNVGELWAIGMALSFLLDRGGSHKAIVVFTDSALSQSLLSRLAWSVDLEPAVAAIRSIIELCKTTIGPVFLRWVPAHVGIPGNEIADRNADHGARTQSNVSTPFAYPAANMPFKFLQYQGPTGNT